MKCCLKPVFLGLDAPDKEARVFAFSETFQLSLILALKASLDTK